MSIIEEKLKTSSVLGYEGENRTLDFMLAKLVEEIGELAVEINVSQGRLPPEKGTTDGVMGEAADVINCVVDIAFLYTKQHAPSITNEDIGRMLSSIGKAKARRWVERVKIDKTFETARKMLEDEGVIIERMQRIA